MTVVVVCLIFNTFFTAFHEVEGDDETALYMIGFISYMILFFIQTVVLLGVYFFCVTLYVKIYKLLKPSKQAMAFLTGASSIVSQ